MIPIVLEMFEPPKTTVVSIETVTGSLVKDTRPFRWLIMMTIALMTMSMTVGPPLTREWSVYFDTSTANIGWILFSYSIVTAFIPLCVGFTADLYGRRPIVISGLLVTCLGSLGCTFCESTIGLGVAYSIVGLGSASLNVVSIGTMGDICSLSKIGKRTSQVISSSMVGASMGPLIAGVITYFWKWQGVFYILFGYSFILFVSSCLWWKETMSAKKHQPLVCNFKLIKRLIPFGMAWGWSLGTSALVAVLLQNNYHLDISKVGYIFAAATALSSITAKISGKWITVSNTPKIIFVSIVSGCIIGIVFGWTWSLSLVSFIIIRCIFVVPAVTERTALQIQLVAEVKSDPNSLFSPVTISTLLHVVMYIGVAVLTQILLYSEPVYGMGIVFSCVAGLRLLISLISYCS